MPDEASLGKAVGRQIVLAAVGCVVIYGGLAVALRLVRNPDTGRVAVMRAAKLGEAYAMHAAAVWANIADRFADVYDKARPVNA